MIPILHDPDSPESGPLCEPCHSQIPTFRNLSEADEARILGLIAQRKHAPQGGGGRAIQSHECGAPSWFVMAMQALMAATGCSYGAAKIWVIHSGHPKARFLGPP
jgi:hypothetical protein